MSEDATATIEADDKPAPPARWEKGMASPNPKGRPKLARTLKDVRDAARTHTHQAIETLARIMGNAKAPPQARALAANALLDRGWGKPASGDFEGAEGLIIKVIRFGDQQIEPGTIEHDASELQ